MEPSEKAWRLVCDAELKIAPAFERIRDIAFYNQAKVLRAFCQNGVTAGHMHPSTGYGYSDLSRDTLDKVFAAAMGAQDAIVRPHIVSGTHALSIGLNGLLKAGQTLVCATGDPYDTLESIIGIRPSAGSLKEHGVRFEKVDLLRDGSVDIRALKACLRACGNAAVVYAQRSSGYTWRRGLSNEELCRTAQAVHEAQPECVFFVDNCYGEFTQKQEPVQCGADCMAGSLIKNPGGGLAPTGGYLCGNANIVARIAHALTAPGIGRECGSYEASYRPFYQGLFLSPHVVGEALKTAALFSQVFSMLGYDVLPGPLEARCDIIQAIGLKNREALLRFCRAIQAASPVDSMATPEPWPMPGYAHDIVMAAGTFVQGASIELSADAPLCAPYNAYLQGGLTFEHGRLACMLSVDAMQ